MAINRNKQDEYSRLAIGVGALMFLLLWGCSSVHVEKDSVVADDDLRPPQFIYIDKFAVSGGNWKVDREGKELDEFKQLLADHLQQMMIERFPEIAPTYPAPDVLPKNGLLVRGDFTRVEQGSRALRAVVGMGAGGTKVETNVRLYDLAISAEKPVVAFKTTGGSNAQPGFITGGGPGPVGLANAGISAGMNVYGLDDDLKRTAREIRNYILHKKTVQDYLKDVYR